MQVLPNLIGHIIAVQPIASEIGVRGQMALCVNQERKSLVIVSLDGGVLCRLQTVPLAKWEVVCHSRDNKLVAALMDNLDVSLRTNDFTLTETGRNTLSEAHRIVGRILSENIRQERIETRAAEDEHLRTVRTSQDQQHQEVFGHFQAQAPQAPQAPQSAEPLSGATFSEQPYVVASIPSSLLPAGEHVRVYLVVEHDDPTIVQQITAKIRDTIREALN